MKRLVLGGLAVMLALSACKKDKDSKPVTDNDETSWQFTANGHTFTSGTSTGGLAHFLGAQIVVGGLMNSNSKDTAFEMDIQFPSNNIELGSYSTTDAGTNFGLTKSNGDVIFAALSLYPDRVITYKVTAYDSVKQVISGTFSGTAYDQDDADVAITNGTFKSKLQKLN